MKVVINKCFGGFCLSELVYKELGIPWDGDGLPSHADSPEFRTNLRLVEVVEKLGKEANGDCAELMVVEIPDGVDFIIQEYDGVEHIAEKHRTWG